LLTLALSSGVWAVDPKPEITMLFALLGTTAFGVYLASRFSLEELFEIIILSNITIIFLSYAFAILLPHYGIMDAKHAGAWRGVFTHKNALGKSMVFCLSIAALATFSKHRLFSKHIKVSHLGKVALPLSFLLLLLSASTGSLLNSFIALLLLLCFNLIKLPKRLITSSSITMTMAFVSLIFFLVIGIVEPVLSAFGKDLTLTGRTYIWPLAIEKIQERPLLGYGYFSFWHGLNGESADIVRALRWPVPNSHNGFIDLALYLGLAGLLIFLISFLCTFIRSVFWIRINKSAISFWPLIYIIYFAQINMTESSMIARNNIFWILYIAVAYSLSYEMKTDGNINI